MHASLAQNVKPTSESVITVSFVKVIEVIKVSQQVERNIKLCIPNPASTQILIITAKKTVKLSNFGHIHIFENI